MKLKYHLEESDFLSFQLYTASKSAVIRKRRQNGRITVIFLIAFLGVLFYIKGDELLAILLGIAAVLSFLFFPGYLNRLYKKHYKTHIKEHYANRIGTIVELEFQENRLLEKSSFGEASINLSAIERIIEAPAHFFVKIVTGESIIIPKRALADIDKLKDSIKALGLTITEDLQWKWK